MAKGNFFVRLCYAVVGKTKDTSKMTTKEVIEEFLRQKGVSSPRELFLNSFTKRENNDKMISEEIKQTLKDYAKGKYGYYTEYSQALNSKSGADLEEEIKKIDYYNDGWYSQSVGIDRLKKRTKELMSLISNQREDKTPLYRIDRRPFDSNIGDVLTWGIRSTTRDKELPQRVLAGNEEGMSHYFERSKMQNRPTIYEIIGTKRHLDISNYSEYNQQESLIHGKFKVKDIIQPEISQDIKKQTFQEAIKTYPEKFKIFTSKSGKEMVEYEGKNYTVSNFKNRTFYNGSLEPVKEYQYKKQEEENRHKPLRVIIEQIN